MRRFALALTLCSLAAAAAAQEVDEQIAAGPDGEQAISLSVPEGEEPKALSANCSGGIVYDDGGFDNAYGLGFGLSQMVMKMDLPGGTTSLDQACICFTRQSGTPSSISFDIIVYDDDGAGGAPGTFLGSFTSSATSIPIFPGVGFYNVNLTSSGINLPNTSVYVGAAWQSSFPSGNIFMCGDTSSTTTQRTSYGVSSGSFMNMSTLFPSSPPRAMGIRADPHTTGTPCVPSATAMCLNNDRFKVEATFATASQPTTPAHVVELTNDSGYLWFFNSDNIELVVKVLNACGVNNRYWVFAAGLTNVRVDITVTDTQTGAVKTYPNLLNTPFPPTQDTNAFATCP